MKRVLDLTAGKRAIWLEKSHPETVYLDLRPEVSPDIVADSAKMPFRDSTFDLIVFDPPHTNVGGSGDFSERYGKWSMGEIWNTVRAAGRESHRVSKPGAFMAFKWNTRTTRISTALGYLHTYWRPLFGHKVAQRPTNGGRNGQICETSWVMLERVRRQ